MQEGRAARPGPARLSLPARFSEEEVCRVICIMLRSSRTASNSGGSKSPSRGVMKGGLEGVIIMPHGVFIRGVGDMSVGLTMVSIRECVRREGERGECVRV